MVLSGYKGVTLPKQLAEQVDQAVVARGFSSRAEFVKAALRMYLATGEVPPAMLEDLDAPELAPIPRQEFFDAVERTIAKNIRNPNDILHQLAVELGAPFLKPR